MHFGARVPWWLGMRWWLALTFALVVALSAACTAIIFSQRSQEAFRERAEEIAAGNAFSAAVAVSVAGDGEDLDETVAEIAERRRLALFVFDDAGTLVTARKSYMVPLAAVPWRSEAVNAALDGGRFVKTTEDGGATVVALPLRTAEAGALVAFAPRPDLVAGAGIARDKIIEAALWGVVAGALVGLLVASLIARRLRRIAAVAHAIESGSFGIQLERGFPDELGALAATIDRMRHRLRESFARVEAERDRLRLLLERLHEGVVTVTPDLHVEFANERARQLFAPRRLDEGYALVDPWPGFSLTRFASGLFREDAHVAEARVSPDEERTYAVVGIPAGRDSESAVLVFEDVSERERRERAEREFVTNAAHELRTPLTTITGAVELLQAGAKEIPEERDRFLAHVEREASRLSRLARALLVLARAQTREEAPRLVPVELRPLLDEVAAGLTPAEGVVVEVDCPAGLSALTEPDVLEQAVSNLAVNAVRHTERGGIRLSARLLANRSVAVEVSDTGVGISPGERERVFDRFYRSGTRDAGGFGLGLAIVREATRLLGGVVEMESTAGGGTTVRVTLPAVDAEAA